MASSCEEDVIRKEEIRKELSGMTFEEIMKLKEELGAKVYKEAILGDGNETKRKHSKDSHIAIYKRVNKNRPREMSARKQVPFLGSELRSDRRKKDCETRDPRFDENCGVYSTKKFKEDYKFISDIRSKEIDTMKEKMNEVKNDEERKQIKQNIQKLTNKNVEDRKWHHKQNMLKEEQKDIQRAHAEGRQPHYVTKKERRAKELVAQFETLKDTGKLSKHLEKRRKKNTAKDRKKFNFD